MTQYRMCGHFLSLLLLLPALSACTVYGIFSVGDPAAGLITAQKDLAAEIPEEDAQSFTLSVVEDYGLEYVVLASDRAFDGTHVWLMDADLNVLQTLSYADLGGTSFNGSRAWFDAWHLDPHRMAIGNRLFSLTAGQLSFLWALPGQVNYSFAAHWSSGDHNVAGIWASGNMLELSRYNDTWAAVAGNPVSVPIGPSLRYSLLGVYTDPESADMPHKAAFLLFRDTDAGTDHFVKLPWDDVMGTLLFPLIANYEVFSRPSAGTWPEHFGHSNHAFISFMTARNGSGGDLVRFDETGAALPGTLHFGRMPDMRAAYSISGTHYFTYDRATRVVSRRAAWWQ